MLRDELSRKSKDLLQKSLGLCYKLELIKEPGHAHLSENFAQKPSKFRIWYRWGVVARLIWEKMSRANFGIFLPHLAGQVHGLCNSVAELKTKEVKNMSKFGTRSLVWEKMSREHFRILLPHCAGAWALKLGGWRKKMWKMFRNLWEALQKWKITWYDWAQKSKFENFSDEGKLEIN